MVRSLERTLGRSHSVDELFDRAMIFHAGRALNTAANIHSMWPNCCDRATDVLRVQTTGKNEESREGQRCSRGRPITRPPGPAAQIGMVCINEHVAIWKQRHIFRAKACITRNSLASSCAISGEKFPCN